MSLVRSSLIFSIITIAKTLQPTYAQNGKQVYEHSTFWHKTDINEIFEQNGHWGIGFDFVYRRKNELNTGSIIKSPMRESFRPWIHYQFSPMARFSISPLGYMHTNEFIGKPSDYERIPYHELRTTFQFFHHHKQLGGRIMHTWRYRYEMRWQEIAGTDDYRYFNRFRFRYRIRYGLNSSDFYANHTLYLAVSNEIGLNFGKNVYLNTFNQTRFYAGIGYRFLTAARVELRYLDRYRTRGATGYEFDHEQGFMIGLYIDQVSLLGTKDIIKIRYFE